MKIPASEIKHIPRDRVTVTKFPDTTEFRHALWWLAKKIGVAGKRLSRIAGCSKSSDNRGYKLHSHNGSFDIQKTSQETRAYVSYLLLTLGYTSEEIFSEILTEDYKFRHVPYHKKIRETPLRLRADNERLIQLWVANQIEQMLKSQLNKYGKQKYLTIKSAAEDFKASHPEVTIVIDKIVPYIRKHFKIDEFWLPLQNRRFGKWKVLPKKLAILHPGRNWYIKCECQYCGKRTFIRRGKLLSGTFDKCKWCSRERDRRERKRLKALKHKPIYFDVMTGRRFTTVSKVREFYQLKDKATYSATAYQFERYQFLQVGEHKILELTYGHWNTRQYQKYLQPLGLPEDYVIPGDPDVKIKRAEGAAKARARRKRLESTKIFKKRARQKLLLLSLDERKSYFWSVANVREHRERYATRTSELEAKTREQDEFCSSHL